ncbi:hypothetical protein [Candidatus Pelagibacter sp. HIMB1587]|uniref:hypothetical protein n=1 Tax=Candidatus Pelagibacter sp. HIMB1587 TaxID=3413354 RepID=UPI003F87F89E
MKKVENKEIDLIDIYLIIRKNLLTVVSITIAPMILSLIYFFNQVPSEIKFIAKTEIKPVSIFSVSKYSAYNNYLKNYILENKIKTINKENLINNSKKNFENIEIIGFDELYLIINEKTLLNLFIDKIKEKVILIEAIKKLNLVNKDNYVSLKDYENAVKLFTNNIILNKSTQNNGNDTWIIQIELTNIKILNSFLLFIEEKTNEAVRKYIIETFDNLIQNEKRLNKYNIEDIEIEILNSEDNLELQRELLKKKEMIIQDKHTERLENLFETTPIVDSNKFVAANILTHSSKITNITNRGNNTKIVVIITFISFILGIFFVILKEAIRNRKF